MWGLTNGPNISIRWHEAGKGFHVLVNCSMGTQEPPLKHEHDEGRRVPISGEGVG